MGSKQSQKHTEEREIIAVYIRLSKEDVIKEPADESNSITNQRNLIVNYIAKHQSFCHWEKREFCDDGYSGTDQQRPAFQRLLQEVWCKKISCIIVKDLSRLGRNYIDVGSFIEQILPNFKVRLIAINDNYDSFFSKDKNNLMFSFQNLINDFSSKDSSNKIKQVLNYKKQQGEYLAWIPPYGYEKDDKDPKKLVLDKAVADVVAAIFQMASDGASKKEIAKYLNQNGVEIPSKHIEKNLGKEIWKQSSKYEKPLWNSAMIARILKNRIYTGAMVAGKYEMKRIGSKKKQLKSIEKWIYVPKMQEGIVSEQIFQEVAKSFHSVRKTERKRKEYRALSGKVKCGQCQHPMRWIRRTRIASYYICIRHQVDSGCSCKQERVVEDALENLLLSLFKILCPALSGECNPAFEFQKKGEKTGLGRSKSNSNKKIRERLDQYEQYVNGNVSIEKYGNLKELEAREQSKLALEKGSILKPEQPYNKRTYHFIDTFVDAVYCYQNTGRRVVLQCKDPFLFALCDTGEMDGR